MLSAVFRMFVRKARRPLRGDSFPVAQGHRFFLCMESGRSADGGMPHSLNTQRPSGVMPSAEIRMSWQEELL